MKSQPFVFILPVILISIVLIAQSCIKGNEPVKEDYVAGEDVAYTQSLLSNIYDVAVDVAETLADSSKLQSTILPATVQVVFADSLYSDGDGIDYYVKFYSIDSVTLSGGSPCTDERTRAGILYISQTAPLSQTGAKLTVNMHNDSTAHYVGNGSDMVRFNGTITLQHSAGGKLTVSSKGTAKFTIGKVNFESSESITPINNVGSGIWKDVYSVGGTGKGVTREGDDFTWFVATTLQKGVKPVCGRTYTQGIIEVRNATDDNNVTINFDPKFNNECDRNFIISLINGTAKTYKVN